MRVSYGIRIGLVVIDSEFVDTLAEKVIDTVLSGLPEEAQTHDVAKYILEKAGKRVGYRTIRQKQSRKRINGITVEIADDSISHDQKGDRRNDI